MITDDFWQYVTDAVEHLEQRSYYQILGVPDDADGDTISHAYYAQARRLHPDRHIKESAARQRMLTRVYARMNEGYRVLSKAETRRKYDQALASGQVRLARAVQAADDKRAPDPRTPKVRAMYEQGRQLLARGDLRGARARWQLAAQFEPDSQVLRAALAELDAAEGVRAGAQPQRQPEAQAGGQPAASSQSAEQASAPSSPPVERVSPDLRAVSTGHGDHGALGQQALAEDRLDDACKHLEIALAAQPRDRSLRALWYAALARQALGRGNVRAATLHRQTALAFDPQCAAARS